MSRHSTVYFVIKRFESNGPCIIVRNTRSRLQLKIWCNTRLDLFVIVDIANILCVNVFAEQFHFHVVV